MTTMLKAVLTTAFAAASTGSIKCDNSNANINSGCDKPGHLKREERIKSE